MHKKREKLLQIIKRPLYYHIYVDVGRASREWYEAMPTTRRFFEEAISVETKITTAKKVSIGRLTRFSDESSRSSPEYKKPWETERCK